MIKRLESLELQIAGVVGKGAMIARCEDLSELMGGVGANEKGLPAKLKALEDALTSDGARPEAELAAIIKQLEITILGEAQEGTFDERAETLAENLGAAFGAQADLSAKVTALEKAAEGSGVKISAQPPTAIPMAEPIQGASGAGSGTGAQASFAEKARGHVEQLQTAMAEESYPETDIILIGNPGVGKSTILRTLSGCDFECGLSFGKGKTKGLEFKMSKEWPRIRFADTPGLSDAVLRKAAAEAICSALKNAAEGNRLVKLLFCVTTESGRVRPDDALTIKEVMASIDLQPTDDDLNGNPKNHRFGLVVNKIAPREYTKIQQNNKDGIPNRQLMETVLWKLVGLRTASVLYLPRDDEAEGAENTPIGNVQLGNEFFASARDVLMAYIFTSFGSLVIKSVSEVQSEIEVLKQEQAKMRAQHEQAIEDQATKMREDAEKYRAQLREEFETELEEAKNRRWWSRAKGVGAMAAGGVAATVGAPLLAGALAVGGFFKAVFS